MTTGLVNLQRQLGTAQNQGRRLCRTRICGQELNGFIGDTLGIAGIVGFQNVFPTSGSLLPKRVRIGSHLNLIALHRGGADGTACFEQSLFHACAFAVGKYLVDAH